MLNRTDRHRILLVGYGQRGRQWRDACRRRRDAAVAGVVDPEPQALAAARAAGLSGWAALDEALEGAEAAVAIVASPPGEHADQALACLRAGLAVLVEKPFALSLHEAARVARESARLGVPAAVAQNFRFLRRERAVRRALALDVGRPLSASVVSARPAAAAMPHLEAVEHGPLWDICIHHLDALRIRFGAPPETVELTVTALGGPPAGRALYGIELRWADGPVVSYRHSEGAPGYHHSEWIECERRAVVVDDQDVGVLFPRSRARPVSPGRGPEPEQAVLDDFLGALRSGRQSSLGADDNLLTVATVEAAVRSEELGRPVRPAEVLETAGAAVAAGGADG
jgi:predicted dehydrogenase